jgi:Ca2+-binding RTX toxin-like protein
MGNDVLVGDANANVLRGGTGRNLIIGGRGANTLYGGGGQNILIGGYTDYDQKLIALQALMREWVRTDLSFNQRIFDLTNGSGLSGSFVLNTTTVHDNGAADALYESYTGALDWFFMHQGQDGVGPTSPPPPGDHTTRI